MGKGGKGKGKGRGYEPPAADTGESNHYFGESAEDKQEAERRKNEMKWKKKLREVEDLEKKRDAGEKIAANQLAKIDTKQSILDELEKYAATSAKPITEQQDVDGLEDDGLVEQRELLNEQVAGLDANDLQRELEEIEQEQRELEEMERQAKEAAKAAKEAAKGKSAKGTGKDPKAPPTVSKKQQQVASGGKGYGAAQQPQNTGVEKRRPLPQATDEQKKQFKQDLQQWSEKFDCKYKFVDAELAIMCDPLRVEEAMEELDAMMAYDLGT